MFKSRLRYASLAAAAVLMGCSLQPNLAPRASAPVQLQSQSAVANTAAFEQSAAFEPTYQNSFISKRKLMKTGETVIKVAYTNNDQVSQLSSLGMDIWMVTQRYVLGQVNDDVLNRLRGSRLNFELISPEVGVTARNDYDPKYHTYEQTVADLREVTARFGNIASLHDIGDTWEKVNGKSNHDIWAVHISGKGQPEAKPGILFIGNHHARELVTVEIPLLLIHLLTDSYGKDPEITQLVDTRDIWIVPMLNADGHKHAEQGENWRKNTHELGTYDGVDLNRNYGFQWGGGGAATSPSGETYRGEAAFSEPETQAIRDFAISHKNLKMSMSYHSFSNLILWPWGYTKQRINAPRLVEIGKTLGKMTGYTPEQASDLYICSGVSDDYLFGQLGIPAYTTEMGGWSDGFDPPFSKVADFWNQNRGAALYLIDQAGK